VKLFIEKRFK